MEDQRQAAVRCAAVGRGLDGDEVPRCSGATAWPREAASKESAGGSTTGWPEEAAFRAAVTALEAAPTFQPARAPGGGEASLANGRTLTGAFVLALDEAMRHTGAAPQECMDDFAEVVARRLANTALSRYEQPAAAAWPAHAEACPALRARIHLAPSGLVTYSLGPAPCAEQQAAEWELSGEGWWRVLPPDGRATEVVLELCQGLEGHAPSKPEDAAASGNCEHREPACVLRVDLRECTRVTDAEGPSDEESGSEEEGSEGSVAEPGAGAS